MTPTSLPKILEAELEQVVGGEHQGPQEQQLHVHQGAASMKHVNREDTGPQPTGCFLVTGAPLGLNVSFFVDFFCHSNLFLLENE